MIPNGKAAAGATALQGAFGTVMKLVIQEGPLLQGDVDVDLLGVARVVDTP